MTVVGTPFYMAPEILRGERYGISVDVWSYGMLIARLCQEGSLTEMIAINLPNKQQQNSPLMRNVNRLQRLVSRGKMLPRITKENSIPHSRAGNSYGVLEPGAWGASNVRGYIAKFGGRL